MTSPASFGPCVSFGSGKRHIMHATCIIYEYVQDSRPIQTQRPIDTINDACMRTPTCEMSEKAHLRGQVSGVAQPRTSSPDRTSMMFPLRGSPPVDQIDCALDTINRIATYSGRPPRGTRALTRQPSEPIRRTCGQITQMAVLWSARTFGRPNATTGTSPL